MVFQRNEYIRKYRKKNRKKVISNEKRWYNKKGRIAKLRYRTLSDCDLTEKEFDKISKFLESHSCEICGKIEKITIDHNHKTKKFRGLLCRICNLGLGAFKDDKNIVLKAFNYLQKHA